MKKIIYVLITLLHCCNMYQLPIIRKYKNIPKLVKKIDNIPKYKAMTSVVVAHGATDLFLKPIDKVYANYFNSFVLMYISNKEMRYIILFIASIFHFSRDMIGSYKIVQSIILHIFFIFKPLWCFRYLAFFHTPLHYYKFFKIGNNIVYVPIFLLLTFLSYNYISFKQYNSLWLVPILGHISK